MCECGGDPCRIVETEWLFPRAFDQSRWTLTFNIDRRRGLVRSSVQGWGGPNGQLIADEGFLEMPDTLWAECMTQRTNALRAWLQTQFQS